MRLKGKMKQYIRRILLTDNKGVTSLEYALIGAFIALALAASAPILGTKVGNLFNAVVAAWP
jgi:Flp pilus assembly pilin Flp